MIKEVEDFLKEYNIKNKTVILGFSSGPDSCALALVLNKLKEKYNLNIVLAYFNHNWRKEAKEEEEFTKDFAKKFNLSSYIKEASKKEKQTEENARKLRYDFFESCAKEYKTDIVFLAHNKNDNVETLIYRIIKGTSIKGLTSISKKRDIYCRPLLEIEKKEILDFLKCQNQEYRIDSSNDDVKYKRNLIRHKILPFFDEINSNYLNSINNLIKTSINSRKIIDKLINEVEKNVIKDNKIQKEKYKKLEIEVRLEIINNFLGDYLKYRNYKNIVKFDNFILKNNNSKTSINSKLFLVVKNDEIFIQEKKEKKNTELKINQEGEYVFENVVLKIEKKDNYPDIFPLDNEKYRYLNLKFPIFVRHRKQGDIFSPIGLKGSMKLKKYLINQKIDQQKKDELILICDKNEVICILDDKISEKYKVKNGSCYKLSWG